MKNEFLESQGEKPLLPPDPRFVPLWLKPRHIRLIAEAIFTSA